MRRLLAPLLVVTAVGTLVAGCGGGGSDGSSSSGDGRVAWSALAPDEEATFEYVIPYGTGVSLDAGQTVDIMPTNLTAHVGDSIRIINKDYRNMEVGPFYVRADQTLAMRFTTPGTLVGTCSISPDGQITIEVLPAEG